MRPIWEVKDHDRSKPFQGFHRGVVPDALKEP